MIPSRVTLRSPSRRGLQHVHDGADTLFQCGLSKKGSRLQDTRHLNGINKIGPCNSRQCFVDRLKIREIALSDFHALDTQLL